MLGWRPKAFAWGVERLSEIAVVSIWVAIYQSFAYSSDNLIRNGLIAIPVMVIWIEFISLYMLSTFIAWLLFGKESVVRPILIPLLAATHLWATSSFPSGKPLDRLFWGSILLMAVNAVANYIIGLHIVRVRGRREA